MSDSALTPANEVYWVVGEDRPGRFWRWALTLVAGYFSVGDGPALSRIAIRRSSDDSLVRHIEPRSFTGFEDTLSAMIDDLDDLDAVSFARTWIAPDVPPARVED